AMDGPDLILKVTIVDTTSPSAAPVLNPANAGNGQVSLTWSAVAGAVDYKIYKSLTSGIYTEEDSITVSAAVYNSSYNVTGLSNGTTYYFTMKASNHYGESASSNEVMAAPSAGNTNISPASGVFDKYVHSIHHNNVGTTL